MITLNEFLDIFAKSKDKDIKEILFVDLENLYKTTRKLQTYSFVLESLNGKPFSMAKRVVASKLVSLSNKYHYPIFIKIANPALDIYKDTEESKIVSLTSFIKTIKDEEMIKRDYKRLHGLNYYKILSKVIMERVVLLRDVFGFNENELEYCKKIAVNYEESVLKERRRIFNGYKERFRNNIFGKIKEFPKFKKRKRREK